MPRPRENIIHLAKSSKSSYSVLNSQYDIARKIDICLSNAREECTARIVARPPCSPHLEGRLTMRLTVMALSLAFVLLAQGRTQAQYAPPGYRAPAPVYA